MDPYSTEKPPAYGQPMQGQQVAYGQPVQGQQQMAYGQPMQGPPGYGQATQGPPGYGQPMQVAYGQPMQGQPMQGQPMQGQPMQPYGQAQLPVGQPVYNQQAMPTGMVMAPQRVQGRWAIELCGFLRDCDTFMTCLIATCCAPCVLYNNISNMGLTSAAVIFYLPLWCIWIWLSNPAYGHDNFSDCAHSEDSRTGEVSEYCTSRTAQGLAFLVWLAMVSITSYYRGRVRAKYGITQNTCGADGSCDDFLTHCCCEPCALTQESVQYRLATPVQDIEFRN